MSIPSMDQAWIMTYEPKAFLDSSKTEKSYHSRALLLGKLCTETHIIHKGPKEEFRRKEGIYMAFTPLAKRKESRY